MYFLYVNRVEELVARAGVFSVAELFFSLSLSLSEHKEERKGEGGGLRWIGRQARPMNELGSTVTEGDKTGAIGRESLVLIIILILARPILASTCTSISFANIYY